MIWNACSKIHLIISRAGLRLAYHKMVSEQDRQFIRQEIMTRKQNSRKATQGDCPADQEGELQGIRPEALEKLRSAFSKIGVKAFRDVIIAYLGESKRRIDQMNQALSQSNFPELQIAAHTLKSGSALVGAVHLSNLCEHMEKQASEVVELSKEPPPYLYDMFSQIQAEYNLVEIALETELVDN